MRGVRGARRAAWLGGARGREALGVAREHRRLADVVQAEEEHDHTRSGPTPPPACGKAPYLKASTYDWMGLRSTGGCLAAAFASSMSTSWMRWAPEVTWLG